MESHIIASVEVVDTGEILTDTSLPTGPYMYHTLRDLFGFVSEQVTRNPSILDMDLDETYGFIKNAFIDYSPDIIDEELGFEVSDFGLPCLSTLISPFSINGCSIITL